MSDLEDLARAAKSHIGTPAGPRDYVADPVMAGLQLGLGLVLGSAIAGALLWALWLAGVAVAIGGTR